jgi:ubiquinone biosynthesis protein
VRLSGPGFLMGVPVLGGLFTLVTAVILARVGGRLLGIRLRWRRAILAGFPGLVLGWIAVWSINGQRHGPQTLSWQALFGALIATILTAVLLELLARPGRLADLEGRLRASPLPHPIRSLRQRAARTRRYPQVTRIAARHVLSSYLGGRRPGTGEPRPLARNLRVALEEAGGMFVKLGQVLSTRADLLPADVIAELSRLQDDVAPADPAGIEALLTAELGASPHRVFASFDPVPLAAASIGQAHRAQLSTGERVIVKVQRPDARALVERDLDILLRMARALQARAAWARQVAVLEMTRGFAAALREELDFRIEARNIAAIASTSRVQVPAVYRQWSTSRVLVLEYLDGVAVAHAEPVLAGSGADRPGLARGLLAAILGQVVAEGTFHADPHPGNVLVLRDGQLALIDFGSVGRLDPLQQAALRRLLLAVARRNPAELHDSLLDLAQAPRPAAGNEALEPALAQFLAHHLGPAMVPDAAMFTALFRLLAEFGLVFPPVIAAVFRAMITLEGTLARLAPGFQIIEETRAMAASWLGEALGPASLRDAATDQALGLLPVLRKLPRRLDRLTTVLTRGQYLQTVRAAEQASEWSIWLLIGLIVAFAALALLNTALMATADRQPELALVRLIGGTRRQARRMIAWEALIARIAVQTPPGPPSWQVAVPVIPFGAILAGVAILGLAGALAPARLAPHTRPALAFGRGD